MNPVYKPDNPDDNPLGKRKEDEKIRKEHEENVLQAEAEAAKDAKGAKNDGTVECEKTETLFEWGDLVILVVIFAILFYCLFCIHSNLLIYQFYF